jgi:hypothetical protein
MTDEKKITQFLAVPYHHKFHTNKPRTQNEELDVLMVR